MKDANSNFDTTYLAKLVSHNNVPITKSKELLSTKIPEFLYNCLKYNSKLIHFLQRKK